MNPGKFLMSNAGKYRLSVFSALVALLSGLGAACPGIASGSVPSQPPFGPDACKQGYVWREAIPSDHVCVSPATKAQTVSDNNLAVSRRNPTGPSGSDTCIQGYVWREAFPGDHVCVSPATRAQTANDNSQAASRRSG